jgi:hypothetical protein
VTVFYLVRRPPGTGGDDKGPVKPLRTAESETRHERRAAGLSTRTAFITAMFSFEVPDTMSYENCVVFVFFPVLPQR